MGGGTYQVRIADGAMVGTVIERHRRTVLSVISERLKERLSKVPVHYSEPSVASKPWTADKSDIFDGYTVEDDGLTFRLDDCMI